MKKLTSVQILIFSFLLRLPALGQTLQWQSEIGLPGSLPGPGSGNSESEYKFAETGPDGKIYSTGYFTGNRTKIGNTFLYADSAGFASFYQSMNPDKKPATAFVACHEANGVLSWAKTIHTSEGYSSINDPSIIQTGVKITFDPLGNPLIAGIVYGDTLYFNGQAFEINTSTPQTLDQIIPRIFILKLSNGGNLIWGKSIPFNVWPSTNSPEVKYLGYHNGGIEILSNQLEVSSNTHKNSLYRYSDAGLALNTKTYTQASLDFQGGMVFSNHRYPDGKFLLAQFNPGVPSFSGTRLSLLQPDLTEIENHRICLYSALNQASGSGFGLPFWPSSIRVLPDGQISLLMGISNPQPDMQLIFDNDTLTLPLLSPIDRNRSLFIRLSQLGCMKKVEMLEYNSEGEMAMSSNGNSYGLSHSQISGPLFNGNLSISGLDRNGESISLSNLNFTGFVRPYSNIIFGLPVFVYNFKLSNNGILGVFGNKMIKLNVTDPMVLDNSFSGCLSNRNIALSTSDLSKDNRLNLVWSAPGEWSFKGIPTEGVSYKLINSFGQTIGKGELNASTPKLAIGARTSGIYYLHVQPTKGNPYSFKLRM